MSEAAGVRRVSSMAEWNGLFDRVGAELQSLAGVVTTLQDFLTPLLDELVVRDPAAIKRLQDLDLLEQSLHGLSDLMACLDASTTLTDAGALAAGVRSIRLSALAERLLPVAPKTPGGEQTATELDLF